MTPALALGALFAPAIAIAQDAGTDGGSDAGLDAAPDGGLDAAPDAGVPGRCASDDECFTGLTCIDGRCGVCGLTDRTPCDEGCGPGHRTCDYDLRAWGPCEPDGAVECVPGERRACDHECGPWSAGPGVQRCDPDTCSWQTECLPLEPIECLPGRTVICVTALHLCVGRRTCGDGCTLGECVGDPEIPCCGNGRVDGAERCDGEPGCGDDCTWTDARPFRSCACRAAGRGSAAPSLATLLMTVVALRRARCRPGG